MKKYALFAGNCYYAEGGASDFIEWFASVDAAKDYADKNRFEFDEDSEDDEVGRKYLDCWAHVAETEKMTVIEWCRLSGTGKPEWRAGT